MISQARLFEYLEDESAPRELVVCDSDEEAARLGDAARLAGFEACVLPDMRVSAGEDLRSYDVEIVRLLEALERFYEAQKAGKKRVLISPFRTLGLPFPEAAYFRRFTLEFGESIDVEGLKTKLYAWGYRFSDIVMSEGEVSFRGDIIDIFPRGSDTPVRISLFDTEIEQISPFDPGTQKRAKEELEAVEIPPAFLALDSEAYDALKARCEASVHDVFVKDVASLGLWHLGELGYMPLSRFKAILARNLDSELEEFFSLHTPLIARKDFVLPVLPEATRWRDLEAVDAKKLIEAHPDKKVTILARNESVVRGSDIPLGDARISFVYSEGIVHLMSPQRLILSLNKPQKQKRVKKPTLVLDELKPGDYVVHETHGVGVFKGIEKREVLGATSEFVTIEYQGGDTLQIPVSNLEVIDRYVADSGTLPVMDKLGKSSFKRLKAKAKEKLFAIASQLINLSAQRLLQKGVVLKSDGDVGAELALFQAQAGFVYTEDQKRAIEEILAELASGRTMDRLLSADVGFGKTEVAMNAMFTAVKNGYQAMMIAPTTLLSAQHFKTLKARFDAWSDIRIAKLDRYTSAKEKKAVLAGLKEGTIDIVVGTHALLKAEFARLALVVVDEEHKFGVKQKEALKAMTANVHVLSMSATPIPRSLNLALSKIKTFSEILTPPLQRVGVRTFVKNYDEKVVKEAILRELRRGGQVFYVFNSIAHIEEKKRALLELLPDLRIAVLHSQISAAKTEEEMLKFEAGEYDVLLSTSIVESGIHLPNANTMIVDGADRFGIADLHQLRGRVGRGGKEGYCYFLVRDKEQLTDNAARRLLALESHSELGSGAVLAFHDLEIRGGGNIIGEAQSGHIKQIGYGLYLRMLEEAICELSGEIKEEERHVEMKLAVRAYLNEELIDEDRLRLELYRRLSQCESAGEVYEIAAEIEDRFGRLDEITRQFIEIMAMKVRAKALGISKISSYGDKVFIEYADEDKAREVLPAPSKDDDDIVATAAAFVKALETSSKGR